MISRGWAWGAVAWLLLAGPHARLDAAPRPAPRLLVPAVSLVDLDGRRLELADLKGKVVLVDFWATWCAPCREAIPGLNRLQKLYGGKGLVVLGLSLDDNGQAVRAFRRTQAMDYRVALADPKTLSSFGKVLGLPTVFLLGKTGAVEARWMGETDQARMEAPIRRLLGVARTESR